LQFGHTLIFLPFIIDQPLNARYLVEKGSGVEIKRGEDGSFTRDGVAKALKLAMVSAEGKSLREKAGEAAAIFGNQKLHQDYYIGQFVDFLKKKRWMFEGHGHSSQGRFDHHPCWRFYLGAFIFSSIEIWNKNLHFW
jgi:hypothetical protein